MKRKNTKIQKYLLDMTVVFSQIIIGSYYQEKNQKTLVKQQWQNPLL